MLSDNEVTEGLFIVVLGANFGLLFFISWHVATARLYVRQVHRHAITIVRKMDCDELIDEMLSCSGGMAEKQRYEGTAGDSLAFAGGHEVTGQSGQQPTAPDSVQNYRERLASVAAGGQAGRYGQLAHGKALPASHIEELDDSEIERLYVPLLSMTEIKQTEESPQTVPVERPAAEPAHVKRVTEKKAKDPKKVAAGRAGAAARQKRLLEQLQAAKESLRPPVSAADNDGTSASPKKANRKDERPVPHWIPWIIGACLAGVTCVCLCGRKHALARPSRVGGGRPRAQSPG